MKKQLTVALGLAVLATPAFASKARLLALGENVNGSFYINDNRNIFLNASEVNNHKDLVTLEWGSAAPTGLGTNDAPNAEGGLYRAHGNMVYGVHFGRNLSFNDSFVSGTGAGEVDAPEATNAIDLFVGGDAGIKWGVQLTNASSKDESNNDAKTNVMDLAAGVSQGNLAGYLKYGISGKTEAAAEVKRDNAMELGASYKWENYTAFGQYSSSKFDVAGTDADSKAYLVGVGRNHKLNDKATMIAKVQYSNSKFDNGTEVKTSDLPLVFGLEYDAASWLALRGSVSQSLYSNVESGGNKSSLDESTSVNAGASLKFGELSVDGVIGSGASATAPTAGNTTNAGSLNTQNLMSYVSMTYKF